MAVGDNIKKYRELRGFSVDDLAELTGIKRANIYNWEAHKHKPDIDSLITLSKRLDITINELLGENITPVQNGSDNKEKTLGPSESLRVIQEALEEGSEYRIVPKTILNGEYRIFPKSELDLRAQELEERRRERQETIDAKNALIKALEDEIAELRSRISMSPNQTKQ